MKDSIRKSLTSLQEKAEELSQKLSDPSITSDISKLTSLNKEFSEIKDVVENWTNYQEIELTILDLEKLLKDEEMKDMAQEEKLDCENKLLELESEIMLQLLPKDKDDSRNSFLNKEEDWDNYVEWIINNLQKFYNVFHKRLNNL